MTHIGAFGGQARDVSWKRAVGVVAGAAIAQLITLAGAPLLTRMYSPSAFGVLAFVTALAMLLGTAAPLRFDVAIPVPGTDTEALALHRLGNISACVLCAAAFCICLAAARPLSNLVPPQAQPWLFLFPPTALALSVAQLNTQLAIRLRLYKAVARQNILRASLSLASQLALAGMTDVLGLLVGLLVGPSTSALYVSNRCRRIMPSRPVRGHLLPALRGFSKFPLLLAPAGLLNTAALQAPLLIMSYGYGMSTAGVLGLTQRLLTVPGLILGQSVAQVYVGEVSRLLRFDKTGALRVFQKTSKLLTLAALIGIGFVLATSPFLGPLLGREWHQVGDFARAICFFVAAQLVVSPVSQTIILLGRAGLQLAWDGLRLVSSAGSMIVAIIGRATALQCLYAYSLVTTAMYVCFWLICRAALTNRRRADLAPNGCPRRDLHR